MPEESASAPTGHPTEVLATPADYIRWAASRFAAADLYHGHGFDNALDEAFYLVRQTLSLPHEVPEVYLRAQLLPAERDRLYALIERRVTTRDPVAYLTGEAWFCGLRFRIDERAIVPRSPMAELIAEGFAPWVGAPPERVLDLCAGCGCIAIATAMAFPEAEIHAVELDPDACALMEANIADYGLEDRLHAHKGDLFAPLAGEKTFDLIVSNPPYVPEAEWEALPEEYHREPKDALAAGEDGMAVVARLLDEAPQWLSPSGVLICEIGGSVAEFEARFPQLPVYWPELENGGSGVFVIDRAQLVAWQQGEAHVG